MLTVHHLNNSRSQRVLWLLEELELPYEIVRYERDGKTMLAPPALRAVHPLGKSPVLGDGALVLAETGAIVEHVIEAHGQGRLRPTDPDALRRWRFWLHHAEGSAMPPLLMKLFVNRVPKGSPAVIRPLIRMVMNRLDAGYVTPNLTNNADYWEAELGRSEWFAGDAFSAADVMMSFPIEAGAQRVGWDARPKLGAFLKRIHARPAYQRALAKGGPYAYA